MPRLKQISDQHIFQMFIELILRLKNTNCPQTECDQFIKAQKIYIDDRLSRLICAGLDEYLYKHLNVKSAQLSFHHHRDINAGQTLINIMQNLQRDDRLALKISSYLLSQNINGSFYQSPEKIKALKQKIDTLQKAEHINGRGIYRQSALYLTIIILIYFLANLISNHNATRLEYRVNILNSLIGKQLNDAN